MYYVKLSYTADEIVAKAAELGVTHIRVNYYITKSGEGGWYSAYGLIGRFYGGEWQAPTFTIDEFVAKIGPDAGGRTHDLITDSHLFLHYAGYSSQNSFDLYLGDIEFVQPVA